MEGAVGAAGSAGATSGAGGTGSATGGAGSGVGEATGVGAVGLDAGVRRVPHLLQNIASPAFE